VSVAMAMVTTAKRRFFRSLVRLAKPSALVGMESSPGFADSGRSFSLDGLEVNSFSYG
jgi:hypothetical protein